MLIYFSKSIDIKTKEESSLNEMSFTYYNSIYLFHDRGRYHIETSPLICSANQWTGFYMITAPVMKEIRKINFPSRLPCNLQYLNK